MVNICTRTLNKFVLAINTRLEIAVAVSDIAGVIDDILNEWSEKGEN